MRSVYGIGNPVVSIDRMSGKVVGTGRETEATVRKYSGTSVGVQCFIDGSMAHISAILGSGANAFNRPAELGDDYVIYPNLTANAPMPSDVFPLGLEWTFRETSDGWSGSRAQSSVQDKHRSVR